jgi:uncharacterized membrane protein
MSGNESIIVILMIFGIVLIICVFILCLYALCNNIGNTESENNEIEIYDEIVNKILARNETGKHHKHRLDDSIV